MRLLLEYGARGDPDESEFDWRTLEIPKGLLVRPGLLYRGFQRVLAGLQKSFDERPHLAPTACPLAVAEMFDKTATCRKLWQAGVPVPEMLDDPWDVYPELGTADGQRRHGWERVYLKLNTGSSATGIIVFETSEPELRGATTLTEVENQFFSSRFVRTLEGPSLQRAARFVLNEGAIVQRGIPMAQIDGQNFDMRVVCLHGKSVATIFRLSSNPMTNLHLGGRRGNFALCRSAIPNRDWLDALDHCAKAADCFASTVVGVDLVFEQGFRRHYVLEVNAFGDFFPGWVDAKGRSIHALEIKESAQRSSN
jgi:hypothetical protein